ncbi:hypothetical protein CRUP_008044 [Coryphaenoides rupestris]|nr:hypothetical protein CRUP_008044 [Coryphaenoides rupestris]
MAASGGDDNWRHREWLCQICGFLLYENIYISIGWPRCRNAGLVSLVIWLKELAVGVVFFRHKEVSLDGANQSLCFEHYPMQPWEYKVNYYRFSVGFLFPLVILSVSYLSVLRAVRKSAGTQPEQKARVRQLVSSTILIFLVCFVPYHIFLLGSNSAGIFNYYQLSLLLTSVNCVADPALYCFMSEGARQSLSTTLLRPIARVLCSCRRRGTATLAKAPPANSRKVATTEDGGYPSVTLLTLAIVDMNPQAMAERTDGAAGHMLLDLSDM